MSENWMIYGAYGYTGELIARRAKEIGLNPILAGRSEEKTQALASELGLEHRISIHIANWYFTKKKTPPTARFKKLRKPLRAPRAESGRARKDRRG